MSVSMTIPDLQSPPDMSKVRNLLIVKLSSIGDVVHALPVSAALKETHPHLKISWVVERMADPIVQGNPYLEEVITLPADWRKNRMSIGSARLFAEIRKELRARRFDAVIDLQGLSKSALIAWASGAKYRYGYDWLRELAPFLLQRIPRQPESVHVVDQFMDVARYLGAKNTTIKFPLSIPPDEEKRALDLLEHAGMDLKHPFLVVNPSSGGGGNKGWGAEKFSAFIDSFTSKTGLQIVLIGGNGDVEEEKSILSRTKWNPSSVVGKTNLKQMMAILKHCHLHLCGDTGSAHVAAALGTPVISLFGRSNPERLAPYGQFQNVIHHREMCKEACRRFHETAPINSKQKCLSPPPACIASITVEEVVAKAIKLLEDKGIEHR